jgi:hypothetical protein
VLNVPNVCDVPLQNIFILESQDRIQGRRNCDCMVVAISAYNH